MKKSIHEAYEESVTGNPVNVELGYALVRLFGLLETPFEQK
jgi:hypothetical protein